MTERTNFLSMLLMTPQNLTSKLQASNTKSNKTELLQLIPKELRRAM